MNYRSAVTAGVECTNTHVTTSIAAVGGEDLCISENVGIVHTRSMGFTVILLLAHNTTADDSGCDLSKVRSVFYPKNAKKL